MATLCLVAKTAAETPWNRYAFQSNMRENLDRAVFNLKNPVIMCFKTHNTHKLSSTGGTPHKSQSSVDRSRWISEFIASLVYRMRSRTAELKERNPGEGVGYNSL